MLSDTLRAGANGRIFKILFWIIILSFVFAGVGNYLIPRLDTDPVKVGHFKISAAQWNEQYNRQTQALQRDYGAQAADLLERPDYVQSLRRNVLESMIDNTALNAAALQAGIRIGDEQIKAAIRSDPLFATDGKFDNQKFQSMVRNLGYTPDYYAEQVRVQLLAATVSGPVISAASVVLPTEERLMTALVNESRVIDLYTLDPSGLRARTTVNDAEASAFYAAHPEIFTLPAETAFKYVLLATRDLKAAVPIDDAQVEEYYRQHQDEFARAEEREVAHILIKPAPDSAAKVAAVEQALKAGEDFAAVCARYSDDANTAAAGGKLGRHGRDSLAPELARAVFALKAAGEITPPVTDEYGTQFLRCEAIYPPTIPPLSEIRAQAEDRCRQSAADKLFNEQAATLADLTFENPDSLDAAAAELHLPVLDSGTVTAGDAGLPWPLNDAAVQKAAFSESLRSSQTNSAVIPLGTDAAVVLNVYRYAPSRLQPEDTVAAQARDLALADKVDGLARQQLRDFAAAGRKELPPGVTCRKDLTVTRAGGGALSPEAVPTVYAIPREPAQSTALLTAAEGRPALAVLTAVKADDAAPDPTYAQMLRAQLVHYQGGRALQMLYKGARALSEVTYNEAGIDLINQQVAEQD